MTKTSEAVSQFTSLHTKKNADTNTLINCVVEALLEKKAKDIVILDVRELTTLTDHFIVCHGTSDTQIRALANNVMDKTREQTGEKVWKREGMEARRWIILDYVNVVIHIFNQEKREYYGIERMWNDAVKSEIPDNEE